jgi:hypothetical protein
VPAKLKKPAHKSTQSGGEIVCVCARCIKKHVHKCPAPRKPMCDGSAQYGIRRRITTRPEPSKPCYRTAQAHWAVICLLSPSVGIDARRIEKIVHGSQFRVDIQICSVNAYHRTIPDVYANIRRSNAQTLEALRMETWG